MRAFVFTPEQIETLREQRLRHPALPVRQKFDVLWLKSQRVPHHEIARLAGVSLRTVQRYLDEFLRDGLGGAAAIRRHVPQSRLQEHRGVLEDHFLAHPPATIAEAQADIERLTGLRRGRTQVRLFLKKLSTCAGARSVRFPPRPTRNNNGRFCSSG